MFYKTVTRIARTVLPAPIAAALQAKVRTYRDACNRANRERKERLWKLRAGTDGFVRQEISDGVFLDLPFDSELARLIYLGGYEETERSFVRRVLRKGDIFVDVGANIGIYSVLAAKAVGPSGVVYAFEPVGKIFERLVNNVQLNHFKNVRCYRLGLSSSEGWDEIITCTDGFDAWSSFGLPVEGAQHIRETVRTTTWDSFVRCEGLSGRVKLIKVDIEGWEGHFLCGAATDLASRGAPHLLIEFNDDAAKTAGFPARRFIECWLSSDIRCSLTMP